MIIGSIPTAYFIATAFIITWIAEKVQALPDYLSFNGYGYYGVLVTLVFLAILPVWKGVDRDEKIKQEAR